MATQALEFEVYVSYCVVENAWLVSRVGQGNLGDGGVQEPRPDKPPVVIQKSFAELTVEQGVHVVIFIRFLISVLMHA